MLLQKAGFSDFRVWREGAQLIALAGKLPAQTEQNLSVYRAWLLAVAQAVPETSDLGLGARARFFRELAASGKHHEAEIAWRELDHATLQRFHKGLLEFYAAPPAPSSMEFYSRPSPEVPHKPLEALAFGTPVVATRVGALPEVLADSVTWADPDDAVDLASAITGVLDDPEAAASRTRVGRERLPHFNWDRSVDSLLELYGDATAERRTIGN
jgi:glycosyltransferase involved in cell wall biosynthesis